MDCGKEACGWGELRKLFRFLEMATWDVQDSGTCRELLGVRPHRLGTRNGGNEKPSLQDYLIIAPEACPTIRDATS